MLLVSTAELIITRQLGESRELDITGYLFIYLFATVILLLTML